MGNGQLRIAAGLPALRWSNTGIKGKLIAGFGLVLVMVLCLAAASLFSMSDAAQIMSRMAEEDLPEMRYAGDFERNILQARIHFIYHVTIQKSGELAKGWENFGEVQAVMPKLEAQAQLPGLASVRDITVQLRRDLQNYNVLLRQVLDVVARGENHGDSFTKLIAEWARLGTRLVKTAAQLNSQYSILAGRGTIEHAARLQNSMRLTVGVLLLAIVLGVITAAVIIRQVTGVVSMAVSRLQSAADGMGAMAEEITASSYAIAGLAQEQSNSLVETTTCSTDVRGKAERFAEQARAMNSAMIASQKRSMQALDVVAEMMGAMNEIRAANEKVAEITRNIDQIAFQTNILALNAAVEAARAGEAGLGFSVVADEVRTLAQRSAEAARNTAGVIDSALKTTRTGSERFERLGQAIRELSDDAAQTQTLADQVSSQSREQTAAVGQISLTLAHLETVTRKVAADAKSRASAADVLTSQVGHLQAISSDLAVMAGIE